MILKTNNEINNERICRVYALKEVEMLKGISKINNKRIFLIEVDCDTILLIYILNNIYTESLQILYKTNVQQSPCT